MTFRQILIASFKAAQHCATPTTGFPTTAPTAAGMLLTMFGDPRASLARSPFTGAFGSEVTALLERVAEQEAIVVEAAATG